MDKQGWLLILTWSTFPAALVGAGAACITHTGVLYVTFKSTHQHFACCIWGKLGTRYPE